MGEKQKMLTGEPYDPADPELTADRLHTRKLIHTLNHAEPGDAERMRNVCRELFGLNRLLDGITEPISFSARRCTSTSIA